MVIGFSTSELLGQGVRVTAVEEREDEIEKFDLNQSRINRNLQTIRLDGGGPTDFDSYLKEVEGISSGVVPQRPKPLEKLSIANTSLALMRGAVKGTAGIVSIPFIATDFLGFLVRSAVDDRAEFEPTVSGAITNVGDELSKLLDPSFSFEKGQEDVERQFVVRAAEKVGEFVTPGAGIVLGLSRKGAQLLSKAPDTLKWWQRAMTEIAKNPNKAQLVEAGLNTGAAVGGETAVSLLIDPNDPEAKEKEGYVRFGAELGTIVGVGIGFGIVSGAKSLARKFRSKLAFTEKSQTRLAELRVGELLNEIVESDAINITAAIKKAEALETETGVKFFTPDLFQNPDLQAAFDTIVKTGNLAATKYYAVLIAQRQRLNKFSDSLSPVLSKGDNIQGRLKGFLDNEFTKLDKRLDRLERTALDEAQILNPDRSAQDIGETGIEMVKLLERESLDKADVLYAALDDGIKIPVSRIDIGVQESKLAPSFRQANLERIAREEEITDLKNVPLNKQVQYLVDIAESNFGKANPKATIGQVVQFRRMVQDEFRIAGISGDSDTMLRLGRILKGVDSQLDSAAKGRTLGGQQAKALKEANAAYAATKARFDKSFEVVGIQKDLSNLYTVAPEDFARRFIRPESRAKSVESAKAFNNIYEGDPQAMALLSDSVKLQLSKLKKGDTLNHVAVDRWLKNHKANLQAHGIWDEFKDVPTTVANIDEAKIAVGMDRKLWERSQLAKIVKVDDVSGFVSGKIKAGKVGALAAEVKSASPAAGRALVREVWDNILGKSDSGVTDSIGSVIRTPDIMLKTLIDNEKDIIGVVGREHFKSLKTIAETVKLQEGRVPTFGARSIKEADAPSDNTKATQSMFSKIRSSLQGFVSPQFTFVQLASQGLDILNSGAAQKVVEEAMYNPEYALKLAKIAKTSGGKEALRIIWLQMTAATIASEDAFSGDDPRTDVE